jgi:hypothetical protein
LESIAYAHDSDRQMDQVFVGHAIGIITPCSICLPNTSENNAATKTPASP